MVLSTYCQYATTCKCKRFPKKTVLNLKKQCRQKENNVNENVPIADNMDKFLEGLLLKTNETLIKYVSKFQVVIQICGVDFIFYIMDSVYISFERSQYSIKCWINELKPKINILSINRL